MNRRIIPAAEIPIDWKTKPSVVDRLLGHTGRPLLNQLLEQIKQTAEQRQWPLKTIKIDHYQDPEQNLILFARVVIESAQALPVTPYPRQ